ncbi:MAG: hypothetical protein LIP05_15860, partial [Tannerellaceae bacterium]|nr:hypothetical protein [Tannerellaceae bacterium]
EALPSLFSGPPPGDRQPTDGGRTAPRGGPNSPSPGAGLFDGSQAETEWHYPGSPLSGRTVVKSDVNCEKWTP